MSPAHILVIDDNHGDAAILKIALDRTGQPYQLELLIDGAAALAFVDEHRTGAREHRPCVIALDLHLPKHSGVEVLAAIRVTPRLSHIKVVVLSGMATPLELSKVEWLDAIFLEKPSQLAHWQPLAEKLLELCQDSHLALQAANSQ